MSRKDNVKTQNISKSQNTERLDGNFTTAQRHTEDKEVTKTYITIYFFILYCNINPTITFFKGTFSASSSNNIRSIGA